MPEDVRKQIMDRSVEEELRTSYLTYAMSVLVARALPDARDGLKPSQRRILVASHDLDLGPRAKHRKCAKIAGDTSGNYHPHGEQVVYPTLVRMAQPFNMRYPLIDGQGNFGSIDGDPPAAMRYTEARMSQAAVELLEDLDKETVDVVPNYDDTRTEPAVLPGRFPNLLANGGSGIAVGMATNIPPHNIVELTQAIELILDDPGVGFEEILRMLPGPDFPTGGIIMGRSGIERAYRTGHGRIALRARHHVEETGKDRCSIVITEIPYQVSKTAIIEKISAAVKSGTIEGIADIRDESDREGMRLVIALKRGEEPDVMLNNLYRHSQLQTTFSIMLIALAGGRPVKLTLRDMIVEYIEHRKEVIRRRTRFLLGRAQARAHIVEGLLKALADIDEVVRIIKTAKDVQAAQDGLVEHFVLTVRQAKAILAMRLQQLTALEVQKLQDEYDELRRRIADYEDILAREERVIGLVREDLQYIRGTFGDDRRTEISDEEVREVDMEDLVQEETVSVTLTRDGYVKRQQLSAYRAQKRGGVGVMGAQTKEDDYVTDVFTTSTHDYLLVLTNLGRMHWVRVFDIPELSRQSRGRALANFLQFEDGERVESVLPVASFEGHYHVFFATRLGMVKKTALSAFSNVRKVGINAIKLNEGDSLVGAILTSGEDEVFLATARGQACRFSETDVRPMGRTAAGVKGISLRGGDEVVSLFVAGPDDTVLTVCENGYGKRSLPGEYRLTRRGAVGVRNIKVVKRNGNVVAVIPVVEADQILVAAESGQMVRTRVTEISVIGRDTQGVRIVRLREEDKVAAVGRVPAEELEDEPAEPTDEKPTDDVSPDVSSS
ncbi:MAG: DNA gyrase subunit A [Planctomycetes bacterium]|nr:DNA gyrase subunit A [Planctomycetota bacterium]